ncbi:hypothetical protein HPB48_015672 [Haemaphysalis longicornis]|uniref:Uncharacterized protein n=1 Tax=Haemaphysalis longicornis TaxID=44386 RepID=A0A9J6G7H5_HAELO|nr:hypothetical protein HPB48_015672 [Haemaphysalis longicornis]
MATGILPPPLFENHGAPAIPWHSWFRMFQNFVLASGADERSATRRHALLLHCLDPEGQRIFDALLAPYPPQPPFSPAATDTKPTKEQTPTTHAFAGRPPDPYDVAVDTLAKYFTAAVNARVSVIIYVSVDSVQESQLATFLWRSVNWQLRVISSLSRLITSASSFMPEYLARNSEKGCCSEASR